MTSEISRTLLRLLLRFLLPIWLLIYLKLLLFWSWLWQLKEYHWKRFTAHFESEGLKKILSSFWRPKFPKLTLKMLIILVTNIILGLFIVIFISYLHYFFFISFFQYCFYLLIFIVFSPAVFLNTFFIFQAISELWQKRILKKAQQKREELKNLLVIGITGSFGKTSTKEFLATILSEKFKVLKTRKHVNAEVGIAKTILQELKLEHEILIAEIGAYEIGKIKQVCQMLRPKIGILTGINQQHMSTFGSQENIIKAKFELIEMLLEDGIAVLNWDDKFVESGKLKVERKKENPAYKVIKYSTSQKEDVWTENIKTEKDSLAFTVFSKDGDFANFQLSLVGEQNIPNVLAAVAVAKELGMSLEEISKACQKIKPLEKTMELKRSGGGVTIVDDTYSANPEGVLAALDYLELYSGKKVIIMPCLIELGKSAKEIHERIGEKIGQVCDLAIITTKDYFKELVLGAQKAGMKKENILLIEKPDKILEIIEPHLKENNVILLESRVPKSVADRLNV